MLLNNLLVNGFTRTHSSQLIHGGYQGSRIDRSRNSRIINDLSSRPAEVSEDNFQKLFSPNQGVIDYSSNIHVLFSIRNYSYIEIRDCCITSKNKD